MNNIIFSFSVTFDYLDALIKENKLEKEFSDKLDEQRENLKDLKNLINEYYTDISSYKASESIDSDVTLSKLMRIHKFITDFEWHISEIGELKDEIIKYCPLKRELQHLNQDK